MIDAPPRGYDLHVHTDYSDGELGPQELLRRAAPHLQGLSICDHDTIAAYDVIDAELLAKHRIEEGLPLCVSLMDPDRWGFDNRVRRCLKSLDLYGGAAKSQLPALQKLLDRLEEKGWKQAKIEKTGVAAAIAKIKATSDTPSP